jgi:hypothetical protein
VTKIFVMNVVNSWDVVGVKNDLSREWADVSLFWGCRVPLVTGLVFLTYCMRCKSSELITLWCVRF